MTKQTHYIPPFTRINGRKQEAVCGAWITTKEHSNEPTCTKCYGWLLFGNDTRTAEEAIGTEPTSDR